MRSGMALHALARIVEQKLDADVAFNRDRADIHVLPALDIADVSPADFSHTRELIDWGYKAANRYLGGAVDGLHAVPAEQAQAAPLAGRGQGAILRSGRRRSARCASTGPPSSGLPSPAGYRGRGLTLTG